MVYHGRHLAWRKKKTSASDRSLWGRLPEEGRRDLMIGITLIVLERLIDWLTHLIAKWLSLGT